MNKSQETSIAIVPVVPGSVDELVTRQMLDRELKIKFFDFSEFMTTSIERLEERLEKRMDKKFDEIKILIAKTLEVILEKLSSKG